MSFDNFNRKLELKFSNIHIKNVDNIKYIKVLVKQFPIFTGNFNPLNTFFYILSNNTLILVKIIIGITES